MITKIPIPPFEKLFHLILFAPLLAFMAVEVLNGGMQQYQYMPAQIAIAVTAGIAVIFLYVKQEKYLRATQLVNNRRAHKILLFTALLLPYAAATLGDLIGAAHYNVDPSGPLENIVGLVVGAAISLLCMYGLTIMNALQIMAGRRVPGLEIAEKVFYSLCYLAVAGVCFIVYFFVYSLHNPTTE